MGEPYKIEQSIDNMIFYSYISNNFDSEDIKIYFDTNGNISQVFLPYNNLPDR